jgi:uncharacterized protein
MTGLSQSQARRIALAAQGLAKERPTGLVTARQVGRIFDRIQLVQIDSVNVLVRSHYLPLFSRLGNYDVGILHRMSSRPPRRLLEYWGHEASFISAPLHPLLAWRMRDWQDSAWGTVRRAWAEHGHLAEVILSELELYGPLTAGELQTRIRHDVPRAKDNWGWNWSAVKGVLEALFWSGRVSAASRTPQFERRYDLTERVLPPAVRQIPPLPREEAIRSLVELAARAHGIGTARCFADYFRLPQREAADAVAALSRAGILVAVEVSGWRRQAYRHVDSVLPRRARGRALLSPFDSLVFERGRLLALFNFHYRIGIYTPPAQRTHGYYVLPFLLGEELVARVDLKADRNAGRLLVRGSYAEAQAPPDTAAELAAELRLMANWLGLGDVVVESRGDLAAALRREVFRGSS